MAGPHEHAGLQAFHRSGSTASASRGLCHKGTIAWALWRGGGARLPLVLRRFRHPHPRRRSRSVRRWSPPSVTVHGPEVAGGAAVLVDPHAPSDIARRHRGGTFQPTPRLEVAGAKKALGARATTLGRLQPTRSLCTMTRFSQLVDEGPQRHLPSREAASLNQWLTRLTGSGRWLVA